MHIHIINKSSCMNNNTLHGDFPVSYIVYIEEYNIKLTSCPVLWIVWICSVVSTLLLLWHFVDAKYNQKKFSVEFFTSYIKVWFTTEYPYHILNRNGQYSPCDNSLISKDFYDQNAHRCALFYIQYFVMCFKTTLTRMANCDNTII